MYCEILSDKVIDISMFIKEKCVSENCNYIYSVDFNSNEYSSRWLRKRFFDHELVAFADIQNDEIKDMILIEKKQCEDLSYCNLLIFPWNKKTLLNYAIAEIYKENHQLMVAGAVYLVVAVFGGAFVYLTATWNNDWASG